MRIVVTGAAGNIGSAVIARLHAAGHDCLGIDKRMPRPQHSAGRFAFGDLADRQFLQPLLEGVDAVCHLGEIPGMHARLAAEDIFATNARIGSVVMQTAADVGVPRCVYTSSCQVYGLWGMFEPDLDLALRISPSTLPLTEAHPLRPQNAYALSKVANEDYGRHLAMTTSMSVAAFRFPAVYLGETQHWARRSRVTTVEQWGEGFWSYIHLDDAVRAYELAIERPRAGYEAYHFVANTMWGSTGLRERLGRWFPWLADRLPADWPDMRPPVSTAKAREHFGWEPTLMIQDAVA